MLVRDFCGTHQRIVNVVCASNTLFYVLCDELNLALVKIVFEVYFLHRLMQNTQLFKSFYFVVTVQWLLFKAIEVPIV